MCLQKSNLTKHKLNKNKYMEYRKLKSIIHSDNACNLITINVHKHFVELW